MLRSREERFRKSVEELNKRLGRAENFLDTELETKMKPTSRSSLPSEVYRDRNTLVEVTVHRNSKSKESGSAGKRDAKSWAESLSDTDLQFDKPTKSSLARSRRSPIKEKKVEKQKLGKEKVKEVRGERSLSEILGELREILQVSGVKDIFEFVAEFDQKKKPNSSSKSDKSDLARLQAEAEKNKVEASRYREEYGVMVKQLEISKESVNNLETQVMS